MKQKLTTNKVKAGIGAGVASLAGFIAWLTTVPPETQSGLLAPFVELVPLEWRPSVGLIARAIMAASTIYGTFKAAQSGPATPPINPVRE